MRSYPFAKVKTVGVVDGPFAGFCGDVEEIDEQTAKVAVQVFGRVTPVDLALGQIEVVPENSNSTSDRLARKGHAQQRGRLHRQPPPFLSSVADQKIASKASWKPAIA